MAPNSATHLYECRFRSQIHARIHYWTMVWCDGVVWVVLDPLWRLSCKCNIPPHFLTSWLMSLTVCQYGVSRSLSPTHLLPGVYWTLDLTYSVPVFGRDYLETDDNDNKMWLNDPDYRRSRAPHCVHYIVVWVALICITYSCVWWNFCPFSCTFPVVWPDRISHHFLSFPPQQFTNMSECNLLITKCLSYVCNTLLSYDWWKLCSFHWMCMEQMWSPDIST